MGVVRRAVQGVDDPLVRSPRVAHGVLLGAVVVIGEGPADDGQDDLLAFQVGGRDQVGAPLLAVGDMTESPLKDLPRPSQRQQECLPPGHDNASLAANAKDSASGRLETAAGLTP